MVKSIPVFLLITNLPAEWQVENDEYTAFNINQLNMKQVFIPGKKMTTTEMKAIKGGGRISDCVLDMGWLCMAPPNPPVNCCYAEIEQCQSTCAGGSCVMGFCGLG